MNFRKFSPTEPSENYHPELRSVAVVAVAVVAAAAEAVANWESRLRRQTSFAMSRADPGHCISLRKP